MKSTLLVAAESRIFREALCRLFESRPEFEVVAEASSEEEVVEMASRTEPDLALLSLSLRMRSGLDAIRRVRIVRGGTRFLVLSAGDAQGRVQEALRAGASAYLDPCASFDDMMEALRTVRSGRFYFSPGVTSDLAEAVVRPESNNHAGLTVLTNREREVLRLIAEGYSNREIADQLRISRRTVDGHRSKLMEKLDLHKASGLVRFAIREGLVAP